MKFHAKGIQVLKGNSGYMLLIPAPLTEDLNNIKVDGDYSIEIKRHSEKRSLNANSYCWVLCQRIAEKLSSDGQYVSKEDVYRGAIKIPKDLPRYASRRSWRPACAGTGDTTVLDGLPLIPE